MSKKPALSKAADPKGADKKRVALLELLDDKDLRRRVFAYTATFEFRQFKHFLDGYEWGLADGSDGKLIFDGFREWLHMRLHGKCNVPWFDLIAGEHGNGKRAIGKFFDYWDAFREDLRSKGLDGILELHLQYELARYDGVASSRLKRPATLSASSQTKNASRKGLRANKRQR